MRLLFRKHRARSLGLIALIGAGVFLASSAFAHVGSPDVFYEGDAGPYHLFVTVAVPQVIPGVAEIQIRTQSGEVREISTAVTRLTGAGSMYAPVPDLARRSQVDPHLFTSSLWLMEYGSLRVMLKVKGARGPADLSVPVPSSALQMLPMPRWLGAILLVLAAGLALGAISIVGAAAREARLAPGAPVTPQTRHRGRRAMLVMAILTAAIFYLAFVWWSSDSRSYAAITMLFKPPRLSLALQGTNQLGISPSPADKDWLEFKVMDHLVPDHGHLMHLFLVRTPGLDRLCHLHPSQVAGGKFEDNLPSIDSGRYDVFADVVDKSGFPWTLVGTIDLPQLTGTPISGDDSQGSAKPISESADSGLDVLPDGTRVRWQRDAAPLQANAPTILRFQIQDPNGKPAADLEPYMGMAAHAAIFKDDLSVFAHIHPSGSVPMAALMMARAPSDGAADSMPGMSMPSGMKMRPMPPEYVSPEISMPYGFPKPGRYRIFFQFKRAGKVETAAFDTHVN